MKGHLEARFFFIAIYRSFAIQNEMPKIHTKEVHSIFGLVSLEIGLW
jgi:hypothetical protein